MLNDLKTLAKSQLFSLDGTALGAIDAAALTADFGHKPGEIIDAKYKILGLLGEGGMGAVYKAHHLSLNKEVALKTFRTPNLSPDSWNRFQREAQAIGRLNHPNIVQVFDFGVNSNNVPYYTMECLGGESLAERLSALGYLTVDEAVPIFLKVCRGLSAAHSKGIIHRDLKPANIFLASSPETGNSAESGKNAETSQGPAIIKGSITSMTTETVKIVDFGIAGLVGNSVDGQKLTTTGTIFGSPLYMSPEQSLGREVTEASDIYSCGCALYETLNGQPPFKGENAFATMMQHQQNPAPKLVAPSGEPAYPQRLCALVNRMLEKKTEKRPQSFSEVAEEFEAIIAASKHRIAAGSSTSPKDTDEAIEFETQHPGSSKNLPLTVSVIAAAILLSVMAWQLTKFLKPQQLAKATPSTTSAIAEAPDLEKHAHQAQEKAVAIKPYLQNPPADWHHIRNFKFPENENLGELSWSNQTTEYDANARGEVTVPAMKTLHLNALEPCVDQPSLLDGFGRDDLDALSLRSKVFVWKNEHIKHTTQMKALKILDIKSNTDIDDDCIDDLNQLTNLRHLMISNTSLTGKGLARLRSLNQLESLYATRLVSMPAALAALSSKSAMYTLEMEGCHLQDNDMSKIATLPNLHQLDLNDNIELTDAGLAKLRNLPKLEALHICNTSVSPTCIKILATFPNLRTLSVDWDKWEKSEQETLKKRLIHCSLLLPKRLSKQRTP
jgi:serine/threonine protein kinase